MKRSLKATTLQGFTSGSDAAARKFRQETRNFSAEGDHTDLSVVGMLTSAYTVGLHCISSPTKRYLSIALQASP